jgi:hypothetical protein
MNYLQRKTPKAPAWGRRPKWSLREREIEIHVLGVTARFGVERVACAPRWNGSITTAGSCDA